MSSKSRRFATANPSRPAYTHIPRAVQAKRGLDSVQRCCGDANDPFRRQPVRAVVINHEPAVARIHANVECQLALGIAHRGLDRRHIARIVERDILEQERVHTLAGLEREHPSLTPDLAGCNERVFADVRAYVRHDHPWPHKRLVQAQCPGFRGPEVEDRRPRRADDRTLDPDIAVEPSSVSVQGRSLTFDRIL